MDVLMMLMNLTNVDILNIHSADYCCIISRISKIEAVNLLQRADYTKKWNIKNYKYYTNFAKVYIN